MSTPAPYPRFLRAAMDEALADTPVVLLHGPRQCGKTTLARLVGEARGHTYITFDDGTQLAAAESDPVGFVAGLPQRVVLDEIQRAPGLFLALKAAVDRDRTPGRFILTGSANVLLVPRLADSLAGRMEILRLHPLSQCGLFAGRFKAHNGKRLGNDLAHCIVAGGYPAALARPTARRRAAWYRDYIETLVQRDVRDLARITSLDALPRLLQLGAGQTSHLVNVAAMAGPFQLSRPTIRDYVTLLERVFLWEHLPPWHNNRLRRLVKTPKLHMGDTGLAAYLLGLDADGVWTDRATFGQLLETFVFQELRRQADWHDRAIRFFHFRDKDGAEVDLVLERGTQALAGIEIKAGATVTASDFLGLRKLREASGARFTAGVVIYDGESVVGFGDRFFAVPVSALWG
jgi:predicted AAA+ superfamily ATPase